MTRKAISWLIAVISISASANPWVSKTYMCKDKAGFFERHLELIYKSPESSVPCVTAFYRDVEDYKISRVLYRAERVSGMCGKK